MKRHIIDRFYSIDTNKYRSDRDVENISVLVAPVNTLLIYLETMDL